MKFIFFILFAHIFGAFASFEYCFHGGNTYREGDYFRFNGSLIKTENPEDCVQCRCHEGILICEIEKCPILKCDNPIYVREHCCQRCPEVPKVLSGSSDLSVNKSEIEKNKRSGCTSNGRYYADGSELEPAIGPLGEMSCVQCRCQNGEIICKRYRCNLLPCSQPQDEFGKCCKVCPNSDASARGVKAECTPKSAELFVFRTPNAGERPAKIEYAFLEVNNVTVYSHIWNVPFGGNEVFTVKNISHSELLARNLTFLGATSYRRFKKYSKVEEKIRRYCHLHCRRRIFRMEKVLKIHKVNVRDHCNKGELDAANVWQFSAET